VVGEPRQNLKRTFDCLLVLHVKCLMLYAM
jgi:hypothetical protein